MRIADFAGWIGGKGPLALLLLCAGGLGAVFAIAKETRAIAAPTQTEGASWVFTWSDEFDAPDGSAPDPKKWIVEAGKGTWQNSELQYYTARPANVRVEKGNLVIQALRETFTGPDGITRDYTSARLKTETLFTQKYGKFEARIRVPKGQGMWPAFWMLGDDIPTAGWPACGEIDIMENIGREPATVHGTIHGPGYSGDNSLGAPYALAGGNFADDFHVFAVEWEPKEIRFYVDGHLYETRTPADLPAGARWAYDHPFFLILNLAVGGKWPGNPDASTKFPQQMLVDYVRVYSRK
ncbi:MAG TPA: glycoside hydrolase family 16 protein [Candidatus Acidoferrum sp.]|nr:glycoside hydrolase family 16 protein [Candidatus Acidoferrum sp.]